MSEAGDYTPVSWAGHTTFTDARKAYDKTAGRSYDDAKALGKTNEDVLPKNMTTDSDSPLIIDCDLTGSMGEWPGILFSKLPYLYQEVQKEYLGDGVEISFGGFDDIYTAGKYPLQARGFAKGEDLTAALKAIILTGRGGGTMEENSELLAFYRLRRVDMPKAVKKPIYIIITDERPYDSIPKDAAEMVYEKIEGRLLSTQDMFEELKKKYSVYLVLKPYCVNEKDPSNLVVRTTWSKYVDDDHIANLPAPERIMDVIFGILAKEVGRVGYFKKELEDRQLKDKDGSAKVATVYKALNTIHALTAPDKPRKALAAGKSTFHGVGTGKGSKGLL